MNKKTTRLGSLYETVKNYLVNYYTKDSEIDITLFKILGTAGILLSIVTGTQSIVTGISVSGGLIDYFAALASVFLLWFVDKTGKYVYGYIITSIGIFMVLFSLLFFEMGGMDGSMPYFFAFGIVFVFLMFKGKLLVIMETLQVAVYTFVCVYSVKNPESVTAFETTKDRFVDQLMGILFSGVGIGLIFLAYIAQYRKQKRLAEEANLAKSRFLANMSHEIRTPINMMMGMNEMIIRESDSDAIKAYATNAEDAGKQLISVVNQILQYSKLEVGKDELIQADYDFYKMIERIRDFFAKEAAGKNLSFELKQDADVEHVLVGDMRKISQILNNLLSNAVKYTREGSVSLTVRNLGKNEGIQTISLEVTDTGIGIEESELSKIFESFERTDLIKNRNIEGTGLGLAIAQNLAVMMDSAISVESRYGEGSKFSFVLNQQIGSREAVSELSDTEESFVAPDAKILAVDDNEMNINVLKSLLKKTMISVDSAANAKECYEKCEDKKYDLILMDLMMPDVDGLEAMRHLRGYSQYVKVPIVALTADVSVETEDRLLSEGFDGYITKPIDWRKLEECLMNELPEEYVIKTHESAGKVIDAGLRNELASVLQKFDIDLAEGLHYMGGDIIQYARVAEFFVKNSESAISDFSRAMDSSDFVRATYILHSLKGNARNVGSIELHYLSKRLEKRCRDNDTEYVTKSAELLIYEWKRVVDGLKRFIDKFRPVYDNIESQKKPDRTPARKDDMFADLLSAIENCQQIPAADIISNLLTVCDSESDRDKLNEVKELIAEIEFEEAEKIVRTML